MGIYTHKNKSNKFSLKEYEKNIENSLIEKIIEEIILNLDSI